ncbi:MAG: DUF1302 domain-containing protein [Rhodanobacter sp.]|jgi:hypothetical protein|nr:DUF1302 domain-containing protein [Rhodanobacter sp.]
MTGKTGTPADTTGWYLVPLAAATGLLFTGAVQAAQINTGNEDISLRWDTTVKYSTAARVESQSPALIGAANPNGDDGDRNFSSGLISNRLDLFSEMDLIYRRNWGARISAAAWYDSIYNGSNDNPGGTVNQANPFSNRFTNTTRTLMGRDVELLDAFVFGKFDIGDHSTTVRLGQHSVLWGESLFFGANAIAGGQQPVDVVKLASVPNTQFKEIIRPVPQVSGQFQVSSKITIGAYYQFAWKADRLPPVGSYFSNTDPAPMGGENLILGMGPYGPIWAARQSDLKPENSGQGGLELRMRAGEVDYGLYAIRYSSKIPQLVPEIGINPNLPPGAPPAPVGYALAYQQGITAFGASASKTFGNFNLAIEGSIRNNDDLASTQGADISLLGGPVTNNTSNPAYAVGRTAHINISTIGSLEPTPLWREATLIGEIAWNRVLSITKNPGAVDPNATRDGAALRVVLEPMYRGVMDGVDVSVPIGVSFAPRSLRPMAIDNPNVWVPSGGGDMSIGLNGSYRDAWRFTVAYTHYYGPAGTFNNGTIANAFTWRQTMKDRDFVSMSIAYTF